MIIAVLTQFAGLFSAPVWGHAQVLLLGAILCQGPARWPLSCGDGLDRTPDLNAIIGIESGPLVGVAGGEDLVGTVDPVTAAAVGAAGGGG